MKVLLVEDDVFSATAVEELPQTLQSGAQLELRLDAFGRGPGDELFGGRRDAELPLRWRRRWRRFT